MDSVTGHVGDNARDAQDRARIADVAARLIAEHGIADWSLAKRKAARSLMLPEREPLPADDEIAAALTEYHALFGGDAHAETLRAQREQALRWMRRLREFAPLLAGGVAAGWAFSDMKAKGFAPRGFVFGRTNPVMVQGAVFANLTITEGWSPDVLRSVRSGDRLRVDPASRTIRILR